MANVSLSLGVLISGWNEKNARDKSDFWEELRNFHLKYNSAHKGHRGTEMGRSRMDSGDLKKPSDYEEPPKVVKSLNQQQIMAAFRQKFTMNQNHNKLFEFLELQSSRNIKLQSGHTISDGLNLSREDSGNQTGKIKSGFSVMSLKN
jgi:hypothetical protein